MSKPGILRAHRAEVVRDLKRTRLPLGVIGYRYRATRQVLSVFMKRAGIERPLRPSRHQVDSCPVCRGLLRVSKVPHNEFLTGRTIRGRLRPSVRYERHRRHIRKLKQKGLVHQKFGCLNSKKLEKAYAIYFPEKLPVYEIGMRAGLKNFHATIRQHRKWGWEVPPPLFVYRVKTRSRTANTSMGHRRRESKKEAPR